MNTITPTKIAQRALELLHSGRCRHAPARDTTGTAVTALDADAAEYCPTGACDAATALLWLEALNPQ